MSCESWHKLYKHQIEALEDVDNSFFCQLFNSHTKTCKEVYLIESGKVPIRVLLSMRRIMFWWHILHVKKSDMLFQVYNVQTISSIPGDWVRLLEVDKEWFKITLSDEEIMSMITTLG